MAKRWDEKFFGSTRGRVVSLLRRGPHTVDELAQGLALTGNGVRVHLATLERDGIVRQRGARRTAGKPAYSYELTPEADRLFPKPYAPVLGQLLDVLGERMGQEQLEELMRSVGRRLAPESGEDSDDPSARLEAAVAFLNELGGLAELDEQDGVPVIRGYSCPLAAVTPGRPEVCELAEALLCELTGLPVQECCDRGQAPRCRFELALSGEAAERAG
ncbi:MAG: helix-turn-helix domain-containing protein [Chloroflexota bacterium]|nr:helix-turn-helix domain-containing protein [Chloroflexota bacterium]